MKRTVLAMLAVLPSTASASAPDTLWTRTYGGANDVRHLAPGVHFVREESVVCSLHAATNVRRVIVTR